MNASLREHRPPLPELGTQQDPRPNGVGRVVLVEERSPPRLVHPLDIAQIFPKETLWILNDAAVLPASFWVQPEGSEEIFELRVASLNDESGRFVALGFGGGDFQVQTELRGPVPTLQRGTRLSVLPAARRAVAFPPPETEAYLRLVRQDGRLFELSCPDGYAALLALLYQRGAPIQYAYTKRPHRLSEVQNSYVGRPWAIEPASAGRHLNAGILCALRGAGQRLAWLTHAAGISSTGDPTLDLRLPLPERYDIPEATAQRIAEARGRGNLVVAVGSSTTRAIESATSPDGRVTPGQGIAQLRLDAAYEPRVVDVLLTGIHEAGSSHRELTRAFASDRALDEAWRLAAAERLKLHEFGDAMLIRRRAS